MFDRIDQFFNFLRKIRFFILFTFGCFPGIGKTKFLKGYTINQKKSFPNFNDFKTGELPTLLYEDGYGKQWLKAKWTPDIPEYDHQYPWHYGLPRDVHINVKENIRINDNGELQLWMTVDDSSWLKEDEKYRGAVIHSNFAVGSGTMIECVCKLPSHKDVLTAFWAAGKGVFECDGFEYHRHKLTSTLHNGLVNDIENGSWRSKYNGIWHPRFRPDEKFYKYSIEVDPIKNVTVHRINGVVIRKWHRSSVNDLRIIASIHVWHPVPISERLPAVMRIKSINVFDKII